MMLIDQLQQDMTTARKNKENYKMLFLSVVLTDANKVGKDNGNRKPTDEEVIRIIKKMLSDNDEMYNIAIERDLDVSNYEAEKDILLSYLPKQMDKTELTQKIMDYIEIENIPRNPKSMGLVMKWLNMNFSGTFDGKTASEIVKSLLI